MTEELVEKVARAIEEAAGSAQFLDWTEYDEESEDDRPLTIREFFEDSWQGEHAEEVFGAAAKAATRAALASIQEDYAIVPREASVEMCDAGNDAIYDQSGDTNPIEVYRAMISAAERTSQ